MSQVYIAVRLHREDPGEARLVPQEDAQSGLRCRPDGRDPRGEAHNVWETCRRRTAVETEAAVQRSVNHLQTQLWVEEP